MDSLKSDFFSAFFGILTVLESSSEESSSVDVLKAPFLADSWMDKN